LISEQQSLESVHPHTLLKEKYVQEAEASAAYIPKFMYKLPKGLVNDPNF